MKSYRFFPCVAAIGGQTALQTNTAEGFDSADSQKSSSLPPLS
jgi:hypothetical protein